ncbi:MAG TPA: thiolase family protein [Mycobacteriales bacterium]|jgi:acetyl-CoA acetyltransferase|nr:thiolase family protein [Mycobacteriales bacterium]
MELGEHKVVISGVGQSDIGRRLNRTGLDLTVQAALAAVDDAGLQLSDIDGISTWPGAATDAAPGFSPCGAADLKEALRLELSWYSAGPEGAAQYAAVVNAVAAVATGLANNVLCFRTATESTSQSLGRPASVVGLGGSRVSGPIAYMAPYNAISAANWIGMMAQRHMHEFGTTREQLGQIPLTCRAHAQLNPRAIYRDPLTLEDYLAARMISTPFCLYDCDIVVDASTVIVVSRADRQADLRAPVRIEAMGTALRDRSSWYQQADFTQMASVDAAASMWERTDLTTADVDCVQLYDGFSYIALAWLEALGFCGHGEGGPFVEGGRLRLGGELPMNTHGGQLSAGRLHGYGFLYEAVVQLRGEAEGRQVDGAEVAVAAAGGGPLAGAFLLTRS